MAKGEKVTKHEYVLRLSPEEAGLLSRALFHVGISDATFASDSKGEAQYEDLTEEFAHLYETLQDLHPPTEKYEDLRFEIVD